MKNAALPGAKRRENLEQAIVCFEKALETYTIEAFPAKWMTIQEELTKTYSELVEARLDNATQSPAPAAITTPPAPSRKSPFSTVERIALLLFIIVVLLTPTYALAHSYLARNAPVCVAGSLNIDGSTALQPLVATVANDYMKRCPDTTIIVGGGASKKGLADVEQGNGIMVGTDPRWSKKLAADQSVAIQIGDSDIFAPPTQDDLVDHQIAIVVFAVILHKDVTGIHDLSTNQLQRIYTGTYLNWSQVCNTECGPKRNILAISRTVSSGTRFTFEKYVLKGVATVPGLGLERTSATQAVQEVEQNADSISYASLYLAQQAHDVTIVSIDGHNPADQTLVASNTYKFWNIEHMYTKGTATPLAQAFINYMYSDFAHQQAHHLGYLNLTDIPQSVRDSHQFETQ